MRIHCSFVHVTSLTSVIIRYYNAYMHFFYKVLQDHTVSEVLEKYLFSNEMNFPPQSDGKKNPQMLSRLLDGMVHPLIHIGYGLELNIPGMLVEGMFTPVTPIRRPD